jgi:endonuclease YncB( thermonuclease family)
MPLLVSAQSRWRRPSGCWRWIAPAMIAFVPIASPAQGSACRFETIDLASVRSVSDGQTFVLDDDRGVRLADIEAAALARNAGHAAKAALEQLVTGRTIVLKQHKAERDRYGRLIAHVFLRHEEGERSVQRAMIEQGHARVAARVGDKACAAELLAGERAAREARLGLWADPYYAVRRADRAAEILAEKGRFTLVEGRVLSVRESGGTIYVNFGRRWSEDFTVTILKRNERIFAAAGLEPKKLEGRRIRVRGWIEERGGPWIEAMRPEQFEIVERN